MAAVPRVLLDEMHQDPANAVGRPTGPFDVVERCSSVDPVGDGDLGPVARDRLGECCIGRRVEVAVRIIFRVGRPVVDRLRCAAQRRPLRPAALDVGHVPNQTEDGEIARRAGMRACSSLSPAALRAITAR